MGLVLCVRPGDSETTVSVAGDIDICVARQLREFLVQAALRHGPSLLLDMSEVSFMDCAGLGAVMRARWDTQSRGGSIRLSGASSAVRRIIELAGTSGVLTGAGNSLATAPIVRPLGGVVRDQCQGATVPASTPISAEAAHSRRTGAAQEGAPQVVGAP